MWYDMIIEFNVDWKEETKTNASARLVWCEFEIREDMHNNAVVYMLRITRMERAYANLAVTV